MSGGRSAAGKAKNTERAAERSQTEARTRDLATLAAGKACAVLASQPACFRSAAGEMSKKSGKTSIFSQWAALLSPELHRKYELMAAENAALKAENERLREETQRLRQALENTGSSSTKYRAVVHQDGESSRTAFNSFLQDRESTAATLNSVLGAAAIKPTSDGGGSSSSSGVFGWGGTDTGSQQPRSRSDVMAERQKSLGQLPILMRAENVVQGVLPLAAAFDKFDGDGSGGICVSELRSALDYLGVENGGAQADALLKQYDKYPDQVLDVKEFANLVRDVRLMLAFDDDGDGLLNAAELQPALESLGLKVGRDQVDKIVERFDVDESGTIDLVELSTLVRTAQAFIRYDKDQSGAIDADEMRDALRKLGIKAGALEESDLFRRYDADGSGEIELHEFATLVRDLQLFAAFDTNADGSIDSEELHEALIRLGMGTSKEQSAAVFKVALEAGTPSEDGGLTMTLFTNLIADLRAFKACDSNRDQMLARDEVAPALMMLGLTPPEPKALDTVLTNAGLGANVDVPSFVKIVKSFADNQSMRKQKAARELMATGAGSVLAEAEERQRTRLGSFGGSDEVQPITHEGDSFSKKLTA